MEPASFERVRVLVREHASIVLEAGKEYLVEARLMPIARARGLGSVDELCRLVGAQGPELDHEIVEAMTTNETSFFRDHYPFEALRETILPDLIRARAATKSLRIWCAASSTGQEPYSIAMILRDHFPAVADWNIKILATDLSRAVLERGRKARYRQIEVNRGISAANLVKFFRRKGMEWELKEEARSLVEFRELNLTRPWSHGSAFDIIMIRNVLIYFDQDTKIDILKRASQLLCSDGYLFLGGSEAMPGELTFAFQKVPIPRTGCYRRGA